MKPRLVSLTLRQSTAVVLVLGIVTSALLAWGSWALNNHNENRLLNLQAKQVQTVLAAAIPSTQNSLEVGAEIAKASDGNISKFRAFMASKVGAPTGFSSVALWQNIDRVATPITSLGTPAQPDSSVSVSRSLVERSFGSATFVVTELSKSGRHYLGYAFAPQGPGSRFAVYAERPLPADRKARVAQNAAFSELDYAIYLGPHQNSVNLLTTDFNRLPVTGRVVAVTVPYGNTVLTTVVAARVPLGGTLSADLPWIICVVAVIITLGASLLTDRLVRRREHAEAAEAQVRDVYEELETLYGQQRSIAETLQRALLPQALPAIPGVEVASRYLPGARGVEVGGDWYSVLNLDDGRFFFVVGDVSGRGVAAASIMARLRFTVRAHALDGDPPALILNKCNRQIAIDTDGHFATVLVGLGDLNRRQLNLASAGHVPPYLMSPATTGFVATQPGLPIGVSHEDYESVTIPFRPGSTVIAFTDGLVERRAEILDVGLKRLDESARANAHRSLDDAFTHILGELDASDSEDDVALLGLRWMN